jgi:hypothetical protein
LNDFERFQTLQRVLVEVGFDTTFDARREGNQAVFSLMVNVHDQPAAMMAQLAEITTDNNFAFTVNRDKAAITMLPS